MYQRWVSAYQFRWTPILTYTRRKLALLDWLEANVEPVAFADNGLRLGIAMVAPDLRLTITRSGLRVESGLSGASTNLLLPALRGVFEELEPRDTVMTFATIAASNELQDVDYNEARARFATKVAGAKAVVSGLRPVDASSVIDFQSPESNTQVEWGIVQASELLNRLQQPSMSRLDRPQMDVESDGGHILPTPAAELPTVSVFTDMYTRPRHGGEVAGFEDVLPIVRETDRQSEEVSSLLTAHFTSNTEGEW